jgi:hypothetical protein
MTSIAQLLICIDYEQEPGGHDKDRNLVNTKLDLDEA